ncbi:DUF177 domain-containing protein [Flavobacterium sp. CBA20B-1]|uniref:YceD family protein n=1 Tax=unclassified Flavobacterium TaxID=196869 RepID=UPI0022256105|nr:MULTISPECIES: DUF177 domain-containing protein [unclassified Flavobacterium]WCM43453.1 DUF177 domain-containing protein [Flavobacterium sp. CBA20B-1]
MINEKDFLIQFSGLKQGTHRFEYTIENDFFNLFNYSEFNSTNLQVTVEMLKKQTMLELDFSHKGTVNVPCDVTNEDFDLPIEGNLKILVKFGDEFNDENEDLLILPHGEFQVNVAQYIYEMIVLSVPYKRVHPDIATNDEEELGDDLDFLDSDDLEMINEDDFSEDETNESEPDENSDNNKETDPRWDKLKKLLTDK